MATYTGTLRMSDGSVLNLYFGSSQAVNTYLPCDMSQAAASTSPVDFRVSRPVRIIDFITDQTAGMFEFISDGKPTGKTVLTTAAHGATNSARPRIPVILRPGVNYRLKQIVAGAA